MARLKNRQMFPPGGFLFYSPETNWNPPANLDFTATVTAIIAHRQGNPRFKLATDRNAVEWELEAYTVKRLQSMKGAQSFLVEGAVPGSPPSFTVAPQQERKNAAGANKISTGISVLLEWLGDGAKAVAKTLSESRAKVCATCEFNKPGGLTAFFTGLATDSIRKTLDLSREMKLTTPYDAKLNVCSICTCPLQLKTHVPISHIERHTTEEVKTQLPEWCWMKKEFTHK